MPIVNTGASAGASAFSRPARLYLCHVALLTTSLAIIGLFFNFTILELGFSVSFLGVLNSASFVASAALGVPLLWVLAYIPLRLALVGGAALQSIGVFLIALWPSQASLLLASGLLGAGAVLFDISAAPFMMRHSSTAARDQLFSANTALRIGLAGVGSLFAGQLPVLVAPWFGIPTQSASAYRIVFFCAGIGLAVAALPLLFIRESAQNPTQALQTSAEASTVVADWRALLGHPVPLLKLLASPALVSLGAALLIPYLNLFFKQRFAVADQTLGLIFAGLGICTGIATLAAPRMAARFGKMATIVFTEALAIPFLLVMSLAPGVGVVIGAALARAALFNMAAPLYDAYAMERTPAPARPTVSALIGGAYSVGYTVGPLLSTYTQARYGFAPLFVATTICYILAVVAKYWFFIYQRPPTVLIEE